MTQRKYRDYTQPDQIYRTIQILREDETLSLHADTLFFRDLCRTTQAAIYSWRRKGCPVTEGPRGTCRGFYPLLEMTEWIGQNTSAAIEKAWLHIFVDYLTDAFQDHVNQRKPIGNFKTMWRSGELWYVVHSKALKLLEEDEGDYAGLPH